jgi:hypothetical protein
MIIRQRGSFLDPLLLELLLPLLWRRRRFWRYVLRWWNHETRPVGLRARATSSVRVKP